jgi:3-oxoacyl-[acyl-carrier-protein] synthase II
MPAEPKTSPRRVVVTAAGVVSPLGHGLAETARALQEGRDGVTPMAADRFDVSRCRAKTAGQVSPARPANSPRLHAASLLMMEAAREVTSADGSFRPELMIIGTTSGGMSFGEQFFRAQISQTSPRARAAWLANYMPQKAVLDAQAAAGFSCPSQIIANACASGTNAIGHAFQLVRAGHHRAILCGGYDVISELVFVGFDSLQASTAEMIRPFDGHRSGLVLGEGAALLALEEMESAKQRGAPILAEITGYGISTDNHHLTQPHPSGIGPRLAMQRALNDARRRTEDVSYINAHGTATTFNDATEGAAIAQLFGERVPVSSTKSMMGHALGAAGAIEAVFSLLALQQQFLPPNIHYAAPDPAWRLDIVANEARAARVECVLSNSFGFGGTNASLVLERAA